MLRLYPVKPIIPINLESFLSVIPIYAFATFDFSINHCKWSSASSVDFSNGRGMYFIVSTFERNSSTSFLSTRLKYSRSVSRFGKGVKFMDNIFCFIYWIRDFNTEFRLKVCSGSIIWTPSLHKISGTQQNPNIQTKVQYKEMVH
jgi:hypothetical protein